MNETVPVKGGELGPCTGSLDLATNGLYIDGRVRAQMGQRLRGYPHPR